MNREKLNRKPGPVGFIPNDIQREKVMMLAAYGVPQPEICRWIINPDTNRPIDVDTLTKHFEDEMLSGMLHANTKVAEALYFKAVGRDAAWVTINGRDRLVRGYQAPDLGAIVWWEKTRRGFKEGMVMEHVGKDGKELPAALPTTVIVMLPRNGRELPGTMVLDHLPDLPKVTNGSGAAN